jgi:uncharacterized membrane protein YgcG
MKTLALLALTGLASVASAAKFTTQRFDVTVAIQPDGTLIVREEIAITFTEPQRGLIRKLPAITEGRGNLLRRTQYELIGVQVSQGGAFGPAPAAEEMVGGDWQVRIGRKDKFLDGKVTYRLDYRVKGAMTPFDGGQGLGKRTELQWNVFPTHWATTIGAGQVWITFPKPKPGIVRTRIIVGALGTRNNPLEIEPKKVIRKSPDVRAKFVGDVLNAELVRPLRPGQTMTVTLALPGDTVVAPKPDIAERTYEDDNLFEEQLREPPTQAQMIGGIGLPFAPLIPLWFWRRRRISREGALVTQFDPPAGLGPAECGLIADESFDARDVVAGMLSLAQKGAAKVRPDDTQSTFAIRLLGLTRAKGLTGFEESLYRTLEPYGPDIDAETLKGKFGQDYRQLADALIRNMHANGITRSVGFSGFSAAGCGVATLFVFITLGLGIFASVDLFVLAICPAFVAILIGLVMVGTTGNLTAHGVQVRTHVKGLREFIHRADKDELRRMSETMPAQALYERLLPYALVFGFVEQWARAFEGMQLEPPEWFEGSTGYDYWTAHQINNLLIHDHAWRQAVVPPAPSSSDSSWTSGSSSSYGTGSSYSSGDSGFSSSSDSGSSSGSGGGGGGGDSW